MRYWFSMFLNLAFASSAMCADTFTLVANPGEFKPKTLRAPADSVVVNGTFKFLAFTGTNAWPAAAYVGVHQGPNRNNSVQVLAIRNREVDDYLVVGYRLVIDGKEAKVQSIENVPIAAPVRVAITFKKGVTTISVNGRPTIDVDTPFAMVSPYASVSSGKAVFQIDP
jgi:hypothetical protein